MGTPSPKIPTQTPAEAPGPTLTGEETAAPRKTRTRRVSFVEREVTSVHIFKRDEDYESPDPVPGSSEDAEKEIAEFYRCFPDGEDSDQEEGGSTAEDGSVASLSRPFLLPFESPSPGGSFIGSATSDDEEDFFGPVSANFIRPGRLSDSAASDDHDITMDSTAFSMHYRSLVRSESGDLRTPSTFSSAVEEGTAATPSPRSLMVLTNEKRKIPQYPHHLEKVSGGGDSNDMSLVGDNQRSYDFAKLSPSLEALLAKGNKELQSVSVLNPTDPESFKNDTGDGCLVEVDNKHKGRTGDSMENSASGNFDDYIESGTFASNLIQMPDQPNKVQYSPHPGQGKNNNKQNQMQVEVESESLADVNAVDVQLHARAGGTGHGPQQHKAEDRSKPNLLKELTKGIVMGEDCDKLHYTHIGGSSSSFSPSWNQMYQDAANYNSQISYATPSRKQPGSTLSVAIRGQGDIWKSVERSSPSLHLFQPSPLASSLKAGILRSKETLSKMRSSGGSVVCAVAENSSGGKSSMNMDAPIIKLAKNLFGDEQNSNNQDRTICKDGLSTHMTETYKIVGSNDRTTTLEKEEASGVPASGIESKENSDLSLSEARQQPLIPMEPVEKHFDISSSGIAEVEIKSNHRSDTGETALSDSVSNSVERLARKLSSLAEYQGSSEQAVNHISTISSTDYYSTVGDKMEASFSGRAESLTFDANINDHKTTTLGQRVHDTQSFPASKQGVCDTLSDFSTPLGESNFGSFHSDVGKNASFTPHGTQSQVDVAEKIVGSSANIEAFNRERSELSHTKNLLPQQNDEGISGGKRRADTPFTGNLEHVNKIIRIEERPNDSSSGSKLVSVFSHGDAGVKEMVVHEPAIKNWKDILLQLSAHFEVLLSPSIDELDRISISLLQCTINNLQKVKMQQLLCSQFQSQTARDESSRLKEKRVAETQLLLSKLVYEKAKLQLFSAKRDKLLERSQLLSSAIRESQVLKSNLIESAALHDARTLLTDNTHCSISTEVSHEKVGLLRHNLEVNEKKIRTLTEAVQSYGKMDRDLSCGDTIIFLDNYIKKRSTCHSIREEIRLWQLDHFGRSGEHNIVLNYLDFLQQRFKIVNGLGVHVCIELNAREICKSFPNLDATLAFAFVLRSFTEKVISSKSLAQETQFVSARLQNLLDVIEEVQLAQIKCKKLVHASFSSPTDEQLDLGVSFIDVKVGRKIAVALDMTCLNCGVYPTEVVPCKVQASIPGSRSDTLVDEVVRAAHNSVAAGYSRILRLCKCISDIMESS